MNIQTVSRISYLALILAAIAYIVMTLLHPIDAAHNIYHLSMVKLRLLQVTIILPIIIIWQVALYGSLKFKAYALQIFSSSDGKHLNTISTGLLVLVASLVLSTLFASAEVWISGKPRIFWTVFSNYVSAFGPLMAFYLIFRGSRKLASMVDYKNVAKDRTKALIFMAPVIAVYVWLLFHNPSRSYSEDPTKVASYFLPDWLILSTLVVPFIATWFLGIMGAIQLRAYHTHAQGIIYRRALASLANGIVAVIVSSLAIQLFTSLGPAIAAGGLGQLLVLLYVLILIYAVGHIWILAGARRLTKIEEAI